MSRTRIPVLAAMVVAWTVGVGISAVANHPPGPPAKTTICHKPGKPAEKTLRLPHKAAARHMDRHGDTAGPCTVDSIIDADGTATPLSGDPAAREVVPGDPLADFPVAVANNSGLDMFDQDGDGQWTFGATGDDLHVEGTAFCGTAVRDGDHDLGLDCKVLDINGDLADQQPVDCDIEFGVNFSGMPECPPSELKYHDMNGNGSWDDGEDIVFDANGNDVFD